MILRIEGVGELRVQGWSHGQCLLSMLTQALLQAGHPARRASEVGVVAPILGEKAGTAPLAHVHTARRLQEAGC